MAAGPPPVDRRDAMPPDRLAVLLISAVVFAVSFGDWPAGLFFYLLAAAGSYMAGWLQRRNLQRAIDLNGS